MNKIPLKELEKFIKEMLSYDIRWAERALLRLYDKQTPEEKLFRDSGIKNGVGFNKYDCWKLTPIIQTIIKKQQLKKNYVIPKKDMLSMFKRLPKYWRQILNMSIEKSRKLNLDDLELIHMAYRNYLQQVGVQEICI